MKSPPLKNNYAQKIGKKAIKKEIAQGEVLKKAKATKNAIDEINTRLTMGDSPQVEEAVMISFLLALTKNISEAFSLYRKYLSDLATENQKQSPIERKLATLSDLEKAQERMERYTALMVQKKAYEKRLEELKENSATPNEGFANKEQEKKSLMSKLKETHDGLEKIYEGYDFAKNPDAFIESLNKSREKWFGVGASVLSEAEQGENSNFISIAQQAGVSVLNDKVEDIMGVVNNVTKVLAQEEGKITMESLVQEEAALSAPSTQTSLV